MKIVRPIFVIETLVLYEKQGTENPHGFSVPCFLGDYRLLELADPDRRRELPVSSSFTMTG